MNNRDALLALVEEWNGVAERWDITDGYYQHAVAYRACASQLADLIDAAPDETRDWKAELRSMGDSLTGEIEVRARVEEHARLSTQRAESAEAREAELRAALERMVKWFAAVASLRAWVEVLEGTEMSEPKMAHFANDNCRGERQTTHWVGDDCPGGHRHCDGSGYVAGCDVHVPGDGCSGLRCRRCLGCEKCKPVDAGYIDGLDLVREYGKEVK